MANTPSQLKSLVGAGKLTELKSRLVIREPYLTIAGQTAPGHGICLSGMDFIVSTNNVIIRYLRSRPGDKMPGERDAFSLTSVDNVIVDHCSASWGIDEQLSTWKSKNVTVQWCLITEALHNSHHSKGNHGFGSLIQCSEKMNSPVATRYDASTQVMFMPWPPARRARCRRAPWP